MATRKSAAAPETASVTIAWKFHLKDLFLIKSETDYSGTIESIQKGIEFKGQAVYTLIFAIFIASIGVNTNSSAVFIGALLISPFMGPFMGAGLALGVYDFPLLKRAGVNLLVMTVISLITSTVYFWISPLGEAQSELLARTSPTVYDVLIAIFGGATGIFASSRRDKISNAIPGVAIATALMPPLCTAGYGIATGNLRYFGGALYLYTINSMFIGLSTLFFVRYAGFRAVARVQQGVDKRIQRFILIMSIAVVLPSIYLAYDIVTEANFRGRALSYVAQNFAFSKSRVLNTSIRKENGRKIIEVAIVGSPLSDEMIAHLKSQLSATSLGDAELSIIQPEKYGMPPVNPAAGKLQAEAKDKDERIATLEQQLRYMQSPSRQIGLVAKEVNVVFPQLESISFGDLMNEKIDTLNQETKPTFLVKWKAGTRSAEKKKFELFIKLRLQIEGFELVEIK